MAVMPEASLGTIRGRIGRNRLFVEMGVDLKFAGGLMGARGGGGGGSLAAPRRRQLGQPISPAGFPPFPPISTITPFERPPPIRFQPTSAFDPGALVGLGSTACNFLSGTARDFCLAALTFLPGGGPEAPLVERPAACPPGMVQLPNGQCLDLTALPPGGDPAVISGAGQATVGAFGLPALSPQGITRIVRKCGRGMVLGIDDLCYPKAVLTGRSKFRKWRRPVRPPISRRDVVAIKRAAGARDRVKELAKDVGLTVGAKRRAPKRHSEKHN